MESLPLTVKHRNGYEVKKFRQGVDGHEGPTWECEIHRDGAKVCSAHERGNGGSIDIYYANEEAEKAMREHVAKFPEIENDEWFIGDLVSIDEVITQIRKEMKKGIVFYSPEYESERYKSWRPKGRPKAAERKTLIEQAAAHFAKSNPELTIMTEELLQTEEILAHFVGDGN